MKKGSSGLPWVPAEKRGQLEGKAMRIAKGIRRMEWARRKEGPRGLSRVPAEKGIRRMEGTRRIEGEDYRDGTIRRERTTIGKVVRKLLGLGPVGVRGLS